MKVLTYLSALAVAITLVTATPAKSPSQKADVPNPDWWKTAVFYQVYPRSFKDSDNTGEGDLQGIIDKLGHFVDAGITAIWLSPIYPSPQVDSGYDISNFRDVDPRYGTLNTFERLVNLAHKEGLKVVMDFVPNHSSDQHDWFIKSVARDPKYENYYVWKNGKGADGKTPPNNWLSIWSNSAWEWNEERQQFYLHQFSKQQPDLNYAEAAVVAEMTDTLKFWLDLGIDGFRIDAIPHLCETGMDDEPPSGDPEATEEEWNFLNHTLTKDQPATYAQVYEWRKFVDEYAITNGGDTRVLMTEAYTDLENTMKYYGDGDKLGAHFSFNFQLITGVGIDSKAKGIVEQITAWMTAMPAAYVPNWVIGNHDNHRVATRYGVANADGMNMLVMMLPGVGVTYNGEEIAMEDGKVLWSECQDPSVCNGPEEDFETLGRDFERTPFHWDATTNAGFNTGAKPWLPVSEKYTTNNLKLQISDKRSHFSTYRNSVALREELQNYPDCVVKAVNDDVLVIKRSATGTANSIMMAFNAGTVNHVIDLYAYFDEKTEAGFTVQVSSSGSQYVELSTGDMRNMELKAHESIIFKDSNGASASKVSLLLLSIIAIVKMFL